MYGVSILEMALSVAVAATGWELMVAGWGQEASLDLAGWPLAVIPGVSSLGMY